MCVCVCVRACACVRVCVCEMTECGCADGTMSVVFGGIHTLTEITNEIFLISHIFPGDGNQI